MIGEKHGMAVIPGRGVGFISMLRNLLESSTLRPLAYPPIALGVSLHDILTRLKAHPSIYTSIDLSYSPSDPLDTPVIVDLPQNGLRLRFDGPDQRLRLIEVTDFHCTKLLYRDEEIFKIVDQGSDAFLSPAPTGPSCRHIYKIFGPAQPGEYVPPLNTHEHDSQGTYVLSYPGIAFTFPLLDSAWSHAADSGKATGLLMSSAAGPALSMALFSGHSWPDVRHTLFSAEPPNARSLELSQKGKEMRPAEVELVKIHGEGRIELVRKHAEPFWLILSETTPQDLVATLGPPDAIYKKSDRRSEIHKGEATGGRSSSVSPARRGDDSSESEYASHTETDDSDNDDEGMLNANREELESAEVFYNYFAHGFDILISQPTQPSPPSPSAPNRPSGANAGTGEAHKTAALPRNHLTATKLILHGNIPGSYTFNRHRRSRWRLEHVPAKADTDSPTSEWKFRDIRDRLEAVFASSYASDEEMRIQQEPMSVHREVGDSPSSSCEIVGGLMEGVSDSRGSGGSKVMGNTLIYPFPGMLFEVLKNDAVSALTIF